ncbi:MAG: DUF6935 domain-containing protein [Candidatus Thorarchaeota archaeon]|jgi:hypothetical protein
MGKKVKKSIITNFKKFKDAWEKDASDPLGSIMYYVIAALNVEKDPKLADAMMTVVVSKKQCMESSKSPSGLKLGKTARYYIEQFQDDKNIARSYVGADWESDYKFDKNNLTMTVTRDDEVDEKTRKIFILSGGADSARPVTVKRNKHGQWKLTNYGSLCVGVRKPASEVDDF